MNKKEIQIISLRYRTLSSQLLKVNSQDELYRIKQFVEFINQTSFLQDYINECRTVDYDFDRIFKEKGWREVLALPEQEKELISFGYQLLCYIIDGSKNLESLCWGYSGGKRFSEDIEAFMRKTVEPFVIALRTIIEIGFIDCVDENEFDENKKITIFLSYCQKDSEIADLIDDGLSSIIKEHAHISRDIRDVEYHQNFSSFMQSIEDHDFVIMIISDNYLKSRNCMFEMLETVKNSRFKEKLLFIVLKEEDKKYYTEVPIDYKGADIYSTHGIIEYNIYWKEYEEELQNQINRIGDSTYAIQQIKEQKIVKKIRLEISDLLEFIRDNKGLSLSEHIDNNYRDMISFMKLIE